MEFIKVGKNYLIKGSNGRVVSEKEKLQFENQELIIKDIKGCNCQQETTKKISKNKKRLKEIEQEEKYIIKDAEITFSNDDVKPKAIIKETALEERDGADDTIEETDKSI